MSQLQDLIKQHLQEKIDKHMPRFEDYHDGEYHEEGHDGKTFCRGIKCQKVEFTRRVLEAIKKEI